ncbi:MAG: hypothetical protein DSY80_02335 [Desulfocapsa sp.]|nr:MAG: hypothetical protein DSY80_02335 [Desulfocapsa sp.]
MSKSVPRFLVCIVFLVTIVLIVLFLEIHKQTDKQEIRETFQSAIGGIGTGATTVPAWNFGDYDLRMQPGGYDRIYPIPGGYSYSPDRLTMISGFQVQ